MSDERLGTLLVNSVVTLTVPDDTSFWHQESPGIHRVRATALHRDRAGCSLQTVVTQAPKMGEVGSALPLLPMSAPLGRPSIRAMLHGIRTTEVLTRAPEWIPLEVLGVPGPATVAQLTQPG
eukprot:1022366-Rhodomonas_salina.1